MADNALYYGDNLDILRRYIADESADLVYLDPPFNSNATYTQLAGRFGLTPVDRSRFVDAERFEPKPSVLDEIVAANRRDHARRG